MPRLFQDDANQHQLPSLIIRVMAIIYDVLIILAIWFLIGAIGVILALKKGLDINCACLGTSLKVPLSTVALTENLTMAIMASLHFIQI